MALLHSALCISSRSSTFIFAICRIETIWEAKLDAWRIVIIVLVVDEVAIVGAYVFLCLVQDVIPCKTDVECIVLEKRLADCKVKTVGRIGKLVHHIVIGWSVLIIKVYQPSLLQLECVGCLNEGNQLLWVLLMLSFGLHSLLYSKSTCSYLIFGIFSYLT